MTPPDTYYKVFQVERFGDILPVNLNDALSKLMEVNDSVEDGDKTDEMLLTDVKEQYE
jgi:hypothetical protein